MIMFKYAFMIPLFPLIGVILNGIFGKKHFSTKTVHWIACGAVFLSFLWSTCLFFQFLNMDPHDRSVLVPVFTWIESGSLNVSWEYLIDPLSIVMMLVVSGVSFLIHVYSIGYMHGDPGYYRFFTYLNLFVFFMLNLVMGGNFLMMFIGWEGVGLCSYLLIGFEFWRHAAADAGKKAFVVNRIGDFGFILAIFTLFWIFGTLNFGEIFHQAPHVFIIGGAWPTLICILLFIGATGKSAQIPLYVWLPDAMEGPTPVSALIHAATMVTAGVYMVARCNVLFALAPTAMMVVAFIGALTAIFAASIGLVQNDIKKVLAYSTISQLGYMFLACGVAAYTAGIFHLMTHAFFKACLFLGAGSVIHGMHHQQDMRWMGGLKDKMPTTYKTFLVATLAIAGIPPFAGFFSKDEILFETFLSGSWQLYGVGIIAAAMTAFYMFRLVFMTFFNECRADEETKKHIHESPKSMTYVLSILALLSLVGGLVGIPHMNKFHHFLEPVMEEGIHIIHSYHPHLQVGLNTELMLMAFSVIVALIGISFAYTMYMKNRHLPEQIASQFKSAYNMLLNKYWMDEIYEVLFIKSIKGFGNFLVWFDNNIIDGIVNMVAGVTRGTATASGIFDLGVVDYIVNLLAAIVERCGHIFRRVQSGFIQNYALIMAIGLLVLVSLYFFA